MHREVSPAKAAASGLAVTLALVAVARAETALSGRAAKVAAAVLGGRAQDHRSLGRLGSFGVLGAAGWGAVVLVNKMSSPVPIATTSASTRGSNNAASRMG